jgi:plastocyanin
MFVRRIVFVAALILVVGLLLASAVPVKATGTVTQKTLYAGEVSQTAYGFGNTASSITSPGPTLNLVEGTTYNMTVYNVSTHGMDHSWEIVSTEAVGTPLWGAGIDTTTYIPPGGSGSVTFTPTQTGNFYYVCTFPGHIALGMYGKVVVSSTIPEFPSALTLIILALAATGMAAFMAKQKTKIKRFF